MRGYNESVRHACTLLLVGEEPGERMEGNTNGCDIGVWGAEGVEPGRSGLSRKVEGRCIALRGEEGEKAAGPLVCWMVVSGVTSATISPVLVTPTVPPAAEGW